MEVKNGSGKGHIAIFPCPGVGHFIPAAEFAKRLCADHGLSVTVITTKWMRAPKQVTYAHLLASSALDIRFTELPDIAMDDDDNNHSLKIETRISNFMEKAAPHVGNILESLPVSALVTDFFCTAMLDVTAKLNLPTHILFTCSASMLCVVLSLRRLVSEYEIPPKDGADCLLQIAGLNRLLSARDLPQPLQDSSDASFHWVLHHWSRLPEAAGILVNTFEDLDADALEALKQGKVTAPQPVPAIYAVGPLIAEPDRGTHQCLEWLDEQPPSSVLFICFGSGAFLSRDQITELAHGLEASGHRFMWVVRAEHKYITFSPKHQDMELSLLLPPGFVNRTRDRGLVVPNWAPQIPILSHSSTGGFFSHCGWNSTLESLSYGVPMIGWPVFAEQRLNRFMLVNEHKVAIDLKMDRDGFVTRAEVERAVRALMDGEEGIRAREKMTQLKDQAKVALMEGGTSYNAMAAAAAHLVQKQGFE